MAGINVVSSATGELRGAGVFPIPTDRDYSLIPDPEFGQVPTFFGTDQAAGYLNQLARAGLLIVPTELDA
jgi:hypothetical protein